MDVWLRTSAGVRKGIHSVQRFPQGTHSVYHTIYQLSGPAMVCLAPDLMDDYLRAYYLPPHLSELEDHAERALARESM